MYRNSQRDIKYRIAEEMFDFFSKNQQEFAVRFCKTFQLSKDVCYRLKGKL